MGNTNERPPMIITQAITVMLIGLEEGTPSTEANADFADRVLNCNSHQTPIANGTANTSDVPTRRPVLVFASRSGGIGIRRNTSTPKRQATARKPAKMRIAVRAHGRSRKTPTDVQMPKIAAAIAPTPAAI